MRVGIVHPQPEVGRAPGAFAAIGRAVEDHGFDHLLVYDHVLGAEHAGRDRRLPGPYTEADPFQDPLVVFGHLAALTERIELVTGVLILPQRQTPLVARQAADVDLLSGGRLRLGIGIGWNHVEMAAMGHDFTRRGERSGEQIELLRSLWSGEVVSYEGTFEAGDRVRLNPAPDRSIPVWIGGFASPAVERAARLADGFIAAGPIERSIELKGRLEERLAAHGRDPADFGFDFVTLAATTEDEAVAMVEQWEAAGGTHVSVCTMGLGLDSVDAYVDFVGRIGGRLGLAGVDAVGA